MKIIVLCFVVFSLFLQKPLIYAENRLNATGVREGPVIDGNGNDSMWSKGEEIVTHDEVAGLSITRNFVELHGGRIWAESEGKGKGSKFRFIIPMPKSDAASTK